MASRRQRERAHKRRVHGTYARSTPATADRRPTRRESRDGTTGAGSGGDTQPILVGARGRPIKPPSWLKALKRAPIFLVAWLVLLVYVARPKGSSTEGAALQAVLLAVLTIPLTYFSDALVYRFAKRRGAKPAR